MLCFSASCLQRGRTVPPRSSPLAPPHLPLLVLLWSCIVCELSDSCSSNKVKYFHIFHSPIPISSSCLPFSIMPSKRSYCSPSVFVPCPSPSSVFGPFVGRLTFGLTGGDMVRESLLKVRGMIPRSPSKRFLTTCEKK